MTAGLTVGREMVLDGVIDVFAVAVFAGAGPGSARRPAGSRFFRFRIVAGLEESHEFTHFSPPEILEEMKMYDEEECSSIELPTCR